jgi:hypothetical protein
MAAARIEWTRKFIAVPLTKFDQFNRFCSLFAAAKSS